MRVQIVRHFHCRQRQARERFVETARTELAYFPSVLALVLRVLPYGLSVTRRPIGQTLPNDAFHRAFGALYVIAAEPHAVVIAEIELRQISVQVLLFAMLVDALHDRA